MRAFPRSISPPHSLQDAVFGSQTAGELYTLLYIASGITYTIAVFLFKCPSLDLVMHTPPLLIFTVTLPHTLALRFQTISYNYLVLSTISGHTCSFQLFKDVCLLIDELHG